MKPVLKVRFLTVLALSLMVSNVCAVQIPDPEGLNGVGVSYSSKTTVIVIR